MKRPIAFIIALIVALSLAGCSSDGLKERRLHFNFDNADYLLIYNGQSENAVKITDEGILQSYADEFNSHKYVKTGKPSDVDYFYRFEWYDVDNQKVESIFITEENGYKIRYNGENYKVGDDLNIKQELYQNLFE